MAAKPEAVWQDYQSDRFIALGIDLWDARASSVKSIWVDDGLASYPMLAMGSGVARDYGVVQDYYFVIDHEGVVRYRSPDARLGARFSDGEIRDSIDDALADLAAALEAVEETEEPEVITAVGAAPQVPARFDLDAWPNPFNAETTLSFTVSTAGPLILTLTDLQGRVLRDWSGHYGTGSHSLTWDGRDESGEPVASGVYVATARHGAAAIARKVTLLK